MGLISLAASSRSSPGHSSATQEDADEETWARLGLAPLMATLLLPIIIGVIVLIKCVFNHFCCVRRTTTKEEMYGVEGRMTMLPHNDSSFVTNSATLPQNNERPSSPLTPTSSLLGTTLHQSWETNTFDKLKSPKVLINNNNPNPTTSSSSVGDFYPITTTTDSIQPHLPLHNAESSDLTDTLKRATGKRQLPDIPLGVGHPPRRSSSVLSQDGTSELYATVGEVPNPNSSRTATISPYAHLNNRQNSTSDSSISKPSTSRGIKDNDAGGQTKASIEPSSDSETYATSNHPYAKLKRNPTEHPYARVRNASLGNDEETDTDNYDMPQPYAQTRGRPSSGQINNTQPGNNLPSASSNGSANMNLDGPVPPRRIGRPWRRGSHPEGQNDAVTHFSGDSQDSRGYTSISVREPLSNIRSQITSTRSDSHYATVSDDSEEMYAAIDDASEGNYMQIPEGERPSRPSWLDAAIVASPIPERREANSPLPPVPAVPPPETPGAAGILPAAAVIPAAPTSPTLTNQSHGTPPVYAQVTKKSKKGKAPVTPTASNPSTSSQIQINKESSEISTTDSILPGPSTVPVSGSSHHSHHYHHRSKSRTLMDNSNLLEAGISEPRRWSKADISYSEFEVVREGLVPLDIKSPGSLSTPPEKKERTISPRESISSKKSLKQEFVDEDNYNVIPDKHDDNESGLTRSSKRISSSSGKSKSKSRRENLDSDNYQEIEPISNTYQEIGLGKEPSDHYQEIGEGLSIIQNGGDIDDIDGGNALYQEIRKPHESEEEDEDQFYEKVKPASKTTLSIPGNSSTGRKHGYEKLKRKGKSPSPKGKSGTSDDDDEDDEEGKADDEEDLMYEKVKYPPYERLKESRSDLAVDAALDDEDGSNFYEHIGYSRVKPKHQRTKESSDQNEQSSAHMEESEVVVGDAVDVNQLYAVVDKTKKKNKNSSITPTGYNNTNFNVNNNNTSECNLGAMSQESQHDSSSTAGSIRSSSSRRSSSKTNNEKVVAIGKTRQDLNADLDFIDDSIDIEYI